MSHQAFSIYDEASDELREIAEDAFPDDEKKGNMRRDRAVATLERLGIDGTAYTLSELDKVPLEEVRAGLWT